MVGVIWILWHINQRWLFNAKSSLKNYFRILLAGAILYCGVKHTGWNDKIVVPKENKHYSFILKLFLKKSIQVTWLLSRADIYSM